MADDTNKVYEHCSGYLGGAVSVASGETREFTSGTKFLSNYAEVLGGAIYNDGTATLIGTVLENNSACNGGGAICADGALNLTDVEFSGNTTDNSGGAMYCAGKVTGTDVSFTGNSATNGGAIDFYCDSSKTTMSLTSASFMNNQAIYGGAIINHCGTIDLTDVIFSGNTAASRGGAIYNSESGILRLNGGTFATQTDTIYNKGTMTWQGTISVAGEVKTTTVITATGVALDFNLQDYTEGNSKAIIENYTMLSGVSSYSVSINQTQAAGTYVLAAHASSFANSITIKGRAAEPTLTLTSAISKAVYDEKIGADYTGVSYTVERTDSGSLNFTIGRTIFVDTVNWTTGASVSYVLDGKTYSGTVGDGIFFNDYDAAKTAAKKSMVIVDIGTRNSFITGDGLDLTIECGTFKKQVIGGYMSSVAEDYSGDYTVRINGGVYSSASAMGDATNRGVAIYREGSINTVVNGGTFGSSARLCGGMYYVPVDSKDISGSVSLGGDVNFAIAGGTFNGRIYGGSSAKNQDLGECTLIAGDVNITVTTDAEHLVTINECLVAGSRGAGVIVGSTNVTFSGIGEYLTFGENSVVFGGSNSDFVKVDSKGEKTVVSAVGDNNEAEFRNLTFADFTGSFGAEIRLFGTISFTESSNVEFTDENLDLWSVVIWNFEFGSSASGVAANEFKEDTLNFDMTDYDGQVWNVLSGTTAAFSDFSQAASVSFDGSDARYDDQNECWTDGTYKLYLNDAKNGMLVSQC